MSDTPDVLERRSRCHCGINSFCVRFRASEIPFDSHLCHCNTCRHVTGMMAFSYLPIIGVPLDGSVDPLPVDPAKSKNLRGYRTSEHKVRYFCNNCSAHLLCCTGNEWFVSSGSLDNVDGITNLKYHIWISDTMDGGLANHIQNVEGCVVTRFANERDSHNLPLSWRAEQLPTPVEAYSQDKLGVHCHCGSVRFVITRPNEASAIPRAGYPDMTFPAVRTEPSIMENPKDEKWWLAPGSMQSTADEGPISASPKGGEDSVSKMLGTAYKRYLSGHCVCNACRLAGGFEVQSWAFVSRANIFEPESDKPIQLIDDRDRPKGLKKYMSSPGKFRESCGTCGAAVFWWNIDDRPDVIDVSIGLVDQQKDGARASDWLKWHTERLSFIEDARKTGYLEGLMEGLAS